MTQDPVQVLADYFGMTITDRIDKGAMKTRGVEAGAQLTRRQPKNLRAVR